MANQELHRLEFEFTDKSGNRVHVHKDGTIVTYDRNGHPISCKSGRKPHNYRTPEDRMREIETRMAGIELRLERLENDGR